MTAFADILTGALGDPGTGWSMGSFGAIAEFHHVAGDPAPELPGGCAMVSVRGGMRLDDPASIRPIPWETLSPRPHRWQQGVSLCLEADRAPMSRRPVLTEIGPDGDALRVQDRGALLFDLGLAQPQVDFCIRTADPALIALLRAEAGKPLMAPGSQAMPAILAAHPHRVALTRIGRIEVFQKIGGPDTGGVSPIGPHTHLLPKLLRAGRTHAANIPIPAGLVPLGCMHPESPVMDHLGVDRTFDPAAFARFQHLLCEWGDPCRYQVKSMIWSALAQNMPPERIEPPQDRFGRIALRVALRQAERRDGASDLLSRWRAAFDRPGERVENADAPGH